MIPGRDLDALIAEKVMGWTRCTYPDGLGNDPEVYFPAEIKISLEPGGDNTVPSVPHYSTEMDAAWDAFETVMDKIGDYGFWHRADGVHLMKWPKTGGPTDEIAHGETVPHVLCLAALKAVGWEGK